MQSVTPAPSPEDLALLDRVARSVARARRLTPADTDDFAQTVHVRMAERRYDVFERFEGRASLRTYLTVVVARLLKDWQNHEYGKWRPSAAAVRLGSAAVMLDRLLNRDGVPVHEAVRMVAGCANRSEGDVSALSDLLPRRTKRRHVPLELAGQHEALSVDPLSAAADGRAQTAARRALAQALADIAAADARLFVERYVGQRTVAALAKAEQIDPKLLYRRFDRIRKTLRARVVAQGVLAASSAE